MAEVIDTLKNIGKNISNAVTDVLASSDFISRTIGMNNSYEDIMFIVQALGREPVSLLGKDYPYIYDHVRRNYMQGMDVVSKDFDFCNKFTFYKEVPTVRFANPYDDPMNLLSRWTPSMKFENTSTHGGGGGVSIHYAEANGGSKNIELAESHNLEYGNTGTYTDGTKGYGPHIYTCDMIGKTNSNFNNGKYETLIARFHTNSEESKSQDNPTQTANSKEYGLSHGRNLLKISESYSRGYDNPYCRVWTFQHQYNQIKRQIRPFGDVQNQATLESVEESGNYNGVGFRTLDSKTYEGVLGGSKALDKYGVLNYQNGTVNIAPTAKLVDYFEDKNGNDIIRTKKCMFSLENLAWKNSNVKNNEFDAYGLSPEQRGPLGGRIMWFPPYNLKFSEAVDVKWNPNEFIGRGENIYTYTNTERTGNLSFTLLIDHPSILDYWTGLDRNGRKNQGNTLNEGNSGGIDNRMNQENTLLRFFAGCDILSAKPQEYRVKKEKPTKVEEPKDKQDKIKDVENYEKKPNKICAILYYPNNYSGKYDRNGVVNPIYYLMNGVGTQKYVNPNTENADNFGVDIYNTLIGSGLTYGGGYETHAANYGVSQVTENLPPDENIIKETYSKGKAEYLTDENGNKIVVKYGSNDGEYTLAKIVGPTAENLSKSNLTGKMPLWYRQRYYYRCDVNELAEENPKVNSKKAYQKQGFPPMSYIDAKSYGLNGQGYDIRNRSEDEIKRACNVFGIEEKNSENFTFISFVDLFVALEGDNVAVSRYSDNNNVGLVRKIFENKDKKYSDIEIEICGHASYQGYNSANNSLAEHRRLSVKNWLSKKLQTYGVSIKDGKTKNQTEKPKVAVGNVDREDVKVWRSASITIKYNTIDVQEASTAEFTSDDKFRGDVPNEQTSQNAFLMNNNWLNNSAEGNTLHSSNPNLFKNPYSKPITVDEIKKAVNDIRIDFSDYKLSDKAETDDEIQSTVKRYDNEGEFFQVLGENEPFLHHLISEKIKYFDPAFHSISPEGFNARLTFLHQCTRQGSTVGNASSSTLGTAYNLAFGRPPICVLRIGDFYNTKILIRSMQITYDEPQWDMNPEGIGMMPMYADITLTFVFLGGSDLAGPIARLQNAVSFNYYANASVYDNRAERVVYNSDGSGREIAFKGFSYPNDNIGDGLGNANINELEDF